MYFQHDGVPPHFSRTVAAHLDRHFPQQWIGHGGCNAWPPRSPDLTPLGYCIWGWMDIVYRVKVQTREVLLERILDAAITIRTKCVEL
ncbi:hypothetical protein B7P43_G15951 [Cryptotermes secundus]|uniref:Tc1-like transposase DDE domain-containing protein n=1 Tax=Cryptotermes secundus TaxID=105785 RepID=A0A2J7RGJ7_9NEOP|nr:hypothetical protein B7P43_G15951 [Cryptotermes secundus]